MAINTNIFTVNWNRLVNWLTPVPLRKPKMTAMLITVAKPVKDLYSDFLGYRDFTNYWLNINPQVCFMQKALNDRWDIADRRIRIVDAIEYNASPLFLKAENKPSRLFTKAEGIPKVLYTKAETAAFTVDFIVKVPADVVFDMSEMRAFVEAMKLASKTFQIKIV